MGLKNFSTVLYRLWRGGFKKVAFTNFRPDRHTLSRADGRFENLGLVMWWAKSAPLVLMGLTDLPKSRGGQMPPCPQVPPSLLRHILIHLPLLSFRVIKMALGTTSILPRTTDTPRELFFQKSETFGLGQTYWAEILWGIWTIFGQIISTILALWVPCPWENVSGSFSYKKTLVNRSKTYNSQIWYWP